MAYQGRDFEFEHRIPGLIAEADRICARCGLSVRTVNPANVMQERALLIDIYNEAFAKDRAIVPISEEVFRFQTSPLLQLIDRRIFLFVECGRESLGVGLGLPDFNEVLARCGGSLDLGTILRWKKTIRSIRMAVALLICVRPKAQGLGISRVLLAHLLRAGLSSGYKGFHTGLVDEQNRLMRAGLKRLGYPHPETLSSRRNCKACAPWLGDDRPLHPKRNRTQAVARLPRTGRRLFENGWPGDVEARA